MYICDILYFFAAHCNIGECYNIREAIIYKVGKKEYSKPVIQTYDLDKHCCLVLSSDPFGEPPGPPSAQQSSDNVFEENPFSESAFK